MPSLEANATKRPLGVTVVAVLLASYAAIIFVAIIAALTRPQMVQSWMTPENREAIAFGIVVFAPLQVGLAGILSAGLWQLQDWARRGVALFMLWGPLSRTTSALIFAPKSVPNTLQHDISHIGMVRILAIIIVLGYLFQPKVANAFTDSSN